MTTVAEKYLGGKADGDLRVSTQILWVKGKRILNSITDS